MATELTTASTVKCFTKEGYNLLSGLNSSTTNHSIYVQEGVELTCLLKIIEEFKTRDTTTELLSVQPVKQNAGWFDVHFCLRAMNLFPLGYEYRRLIVFTNARLDIEAKNERRAKRVAKRIAKSKLV
jgi:hypothetical protein